MSILLPFTPLKINNLSINSQGTIGTSLKYYIMGFLLNSGKKICHREKICWNPLIHTIKFCLVSCGILQTFFALILLSLQMFFFFSKPPYLCVFPNKHDQLQKGFGFPSHSNDIRCRIIFLVHIVGRKKALLLISNNKYFLKNSSDLKKLYRYR